jgi:hypothetical protein
VLAVVLLGVACGPKGGGEAKEAIVLTWVGSSDAGLFAAGDYQDLGSSGPANTGEAGLLEIDPETGSPLGEWHLGRNRHVLGLAGEGLVTANLLANRATLSLLPLRSERPAALATFDGSGGGCAFAAPHGVLPGDVLVLPCADTTPATSAMVVRVDGASFTLLGVLQGDGCPLSAVTGETLLCLSEGGHLRRYALSDLSLQGEVTGLPVMDGTRMVRSNLALVAPDRIGLVPPPSENPGAETYEVYTVPTSGDASKVAGITLPAGVLGWCQDAWWTGSAAFVTCKEGSALVGGDPLAVQAKATWPGFGTVVAPLEGGRLAVAASGIVILDASLEPTGGYRRLWQKNPLNGEYSLDEGSYGP